MNVKKINCRDVMNHICESLGEELESQKCIEIKEHLSDCPNFNVGSNYQTEEKRLRKLHFNVVYVQAPSIVPILIGLQ